MLFPSCFCVALRRCHAARCRREAGELEGHNLFKKMKAKLGVPTKIGRFLINTVVVVGKTHLDVFRGRVWQWGQGDPSLVKCDTQNRMLFCWRLRDQQLALAAIYPWWAMWCVISEG